MFFFKGSKDENVAKIVIFSRNLLQVSGFLFTFALAKLKIVICLRAVQDAQSRNSGHFYCLILLRTHDPRLTISGGTPVEVYVLGRVL